ncbi:MAG: MmcQ/YjbR family DNA-binding protein [Ruminococcus sp.]|nr:MmcQ/YjbR family DNA-binding protein [Ruminococcus sp.]
MTDRQLFDHVKEHYGAEPEYLWKRTPDAAVLRRSDNNKWFALIMTVQASKLGIGSDRRVRILNVKCDPLMGGSLIKKEGYFPGYHMNKQAWISILLDGTVPEEEVISAIDISYTLTG